MASLRPSLSPHLPLPPLPAALNFQLLLRRCPPPFLLSCIFPSILPSTGTSSFLEQLLSVSWYLMLNNVGRYYYYYYFSQTGLFAAPHHDQLLTLVYLVPSQNGHLPNPILFLWKSSQSSGSIPPSPLSLITIATGILSFP